MVLYINVVIFIVQNTIFGLILNINLIFLILVIYLYFYTEILLIALKNKCRAST